MINFEEKTHTYTEDGRVLISVTQLLKKHNIIPDLSMVNKEVLEKARLRGVAIHSQVESWLKFNDKTEIGEEAMQIINIFESYKKSKKKIESEYIVASHNTLCPYAGTIDLLVIDGKTKKTKLYDIKTSKTWSREQELSARWQLSLYARAVKELGYDVENLTVLGFKNGELEIRAIQPIEEDKINDLLLAESKNQQYELTTTLNSELLNNDAIMLFKRLESQQKLIKDLTEQTEEIKNKIYEYMKNNDIYNATSEDGSIELTRKRDAEVKSIDAKKLKEEEPKIYEKYLKTSIRKGSISVKVNVEDVLC